MKYSSTVRTINVVLFALLFAGFAFLGIWFGFLTVPFQWRGGSGSPLAGSFPSTSFGLAATLGIFGIAGALVAGKGLVTSVLSMGRSNDDDIVVRSFGSYIGVGFVVAFFLLLNATWLYRLTTTNFKYDDVAFVIVVYVIGFLLVGFATLVPLSKIFGDKDRYNDIMKILASTFGFSLLAVAAVFFGAFINMLQFKDTTANSSQLLLEFGLGFGIPLAAAICYCAALLGYNKTSKDNVVRKSSGFLFEAGMCFTGSAIIVAGVLENIFQAKELRISLVASEVIAKNPNYMDFAIMSYIVGGLIVLASIYFAYQTALGNKAKVVKED